VNVVVLNPIWPDALARLQARHRCLVAVQPTIAALHAALAEAEVAVMRSPVRLDRTALEAAAGLRLIVRAGMGLEGIDLTCARERGVGVVAVPLSAESVAEHALGLMLALSHRIAWHDRSLRAGRWEKHAGYGRDLAGRRLGLLGFGRIGVQLAELARAFGMPLSAHDRSPNRPHKQEAARRLGVDFVGLEELVAAVDILSIQTPLDDTTRGLIDRRLLGLMKPDAILVNVGRGGVVDERALCEALAGGRLAGAALDVFAVEPPGESPLLRLDNFLGTAHAAAQTLDAQRQVGEAVVALVEAFAAGTDLARYGVVVCPPSEVREP
jgi:phosphoglycerate dehydrogenase-like enzyme